MRERNEDIIPLAEHFLTLSAQELQIEQKKLQPETQQFLNMLDWPGNVRQLENFCRWITVMASGREIHIDDLPPELRESGVSKNVTSDWEDRLRVWAKSNLLQGKSKLLDDAIPKIERIMIEVALQQTGGRRQDAAKLLGCGRNTLTRKIKELNL